VVAENWKKTIISRYFLTIYLSKMTIIAFTTGIFAAFSNFFYKLGRKGITHTHKFFQFFLSNSFLKISKSIPFSPQASYFLDQNSLRK
jgi:hypothetical protein